MRKKPLELTGISHSGKRRTLSARLETVRYLTAANLSSGRRRATPVQHIADALIEAGYTTLDEQAKALGIHRATAWTIVKTKHKLGRLNTGTTKRILANPDTPPTVRAVVQQYSTEKFLAKSLTDD